MNLEEDERFIKCLAASFVDSRINDDSKISIKSSTMEIVHSAEVMCHKQKNSGLGRKDKPALRLKQLRFHHAINQIILRPLIVVLKSLPVEVNNSDDNLTKMCIAL